LPDLTCEAHEAQKFSRISENEKEFFKKVFKIQNGFAACFTVQTLVGKFSASPSIRSCLQAQGNPLPFIV